MRADQKRVCCGVRRTFCSLAMDGGIPRGSGRGAADVAGGDETHAVAVVNGRASCDDGGFPAGQRFVWQQLCLSPSLCPLTSRHTLSRSGGFSAVMAIDRQIIREKAAVCYSSREDVREGLSDEQQLSGADHQALLFFQGPCPTRQTDPFKRGIAAVSHPPPSPLIDRRKDEPRRPVREESQGRGTRSFPREGGGQTLMTPRATRGLAGSANCRSNTDARGGRRFRAKFVRGCKKDRWFSFLTDAVRRPTDGMRKGSSFGSE